MTAGRKPQPDSKRGQKRSPAVLRGDRPVAPAHLTETQAQAFGELAEACDAVVDGGDVAMLETAAVQLARARDATAEIELDGMLVANRFGHLEPNPMLRVEHAAWSAVRLSCAELGIGPAARYRLSAAGQPGADAGVALPAVGELRALRGGKD